MRASAATARSSSSFCSIGTENGIGDDLGPVGIAVGRCRRQLDRLETERGVGLGDLDGLAGGAGDGLACHFVRGREPPGAVGEHAKPEAERSRVRDRRHLDRLAGRAVGLHAEADVLAAIAVDADIGVGGAGRPGPLDRERRQLAELAHIELGRARPKGATSRHWQARSTPPHRRRNDREMPVETASRTPPSLPNYALQNSERFAGAKPIRVKLSRRRTVRNVSASGKMSISVIDSTPGEIHHMVDTVESLILDLLEWLVRDERTYAEVMDAWATSCPRLPVWEDATDRGLVERDHSNGRTIVRVSSKGVAFLTSA